MLTGILILLVSCLRTNRPEFFKIYGRAKNTFLKSLGDILPDNLLGFVVGNVKILTYLWNSNENCKWLLCSQFSEIGIKY